LFGLLYLSCFPFADIALIIGAVIGLVVVVVIVLGGVYYYQKRRKESPKQRFSTKVYKIV